MPIVHWQSMSVSKMLFIEVLSYVGQKIKLYCIHPKRMFSYFN